MQGSGSSLAPKAPERECGRNIRYRDDDAPERLSRGPFPLEGVVPRPNPGQAGHRGGARGECPPSRRARIVRRGARPYRHGAHDLFACPLGRTRGGWRSRKDWIRALDTIESLQPRAVVASHKRPENDDSPRIIEETRQYIRDFDRLVEMTTTAQQLYDRMLELYPNRVNAGWALWSSARAVKR